MRIGTRWGGWWALCVLMGTVWGQEAPQPNTAQAPLRVELKEGKPPVLINVQSGLIANGLDLDLGVATPQEGGKYWIGVGCTAEMPDALRAQLGLEGEQGLLVYDVVAEGPGKAAGIQQHDVLLTVRLGEMDSVRLTNVPQLIELVQKAELKPLAIELLRAGKTIPLTVEPKERPQVEVNGVTDLDVVYVGDAVHVLAAPDTRYEELRRKLEELEKLVGPKHPISVRMAGPIVPTRSRQAGADGVSVSIAKQGQEPAQITVQKGDQRWSVGENQLDQLPEDLQDRVRQWLRSTAQKPEMVAGCLWMKRGDCRACHSLPAEPMTVVAPREMPGNPKRATAQPVVPSPVAISTPPRLASVAELQQLSLTLMRLHEQQAKVQQEQTKALLTELKALREAIEKK